MPRLADLRIAGRDGHRNDAGGPIPRRSQLGLRRRVPVRRAEQLWRPAGLAASWSTRPTRHGLAVILDVVYNHLGPEGNYFGQVRAVLHRPLPHAVGTGDQLRRAGQRCRPAVRDRQRLHVGPRFPRRRPAARCRPGDLRLRRRATSWRRSRRPSNRKPLAPAARSTSLPRAIRTTCGWSTRPTAAVTDWTPYGATISTTAYTPC